MQSEPAGLLPPWVGLGVFAGYAAVTLLGAALVVARRDI
jgi:hypothetical protein